MASHRVLQQCPARKVFRVNYLEEGWVDQSLMGLQGGDSEYQPPRGPCLHRALWGWSVSKECLRETPPTSPWGVGKRKDGVSGECFERTSSLLPDSWWSAESPPHSQRPLLERALPVTGPRGSKTRGIDGLLDVGHSQRKA